MQLIKKKVNFKSFFIGIYFILSILLILFSKKNLADVYSFFSLLLLIPTLLIISYFNYKNKSFKNKRLIYEIFFLFSLSIIGFIFSNKDLIFLKNYTYLILTLYMFNSLLISKNILIINYINRTTNFIINLSAFCFLIWIAYYYIFECSKYAHCPLVYISRQFHYHLIFHTNLFNIFLIFNLLQLFNNTKKFDKITFLSNTILSLSSASMIINIFWIIVTIYYFLKRNFLYKKILDVIILFILFLFIILIINYNENLIIFFQRNTNDLLINNLINVGEIDSITWRLEKTGDFVKYFLGTITLFPEKIFFGNEFIQQENFFHNSFFSIYHFYGLFIFLYILYSVFKLKNLFQISIIISYFYTTDNLMMHDYSITLCTWILMTTLVYKNQQKIY